MKAKAEAAAALKAEMEKPFEFAFMVDGNKNGVAGLPNNNWALECILHF